MDWIDEILNKKYSVWSISCHNLKKLVKMTQGIEKVTSDVSRVSEPWLPKTENLAFLVKICKIETIKNWFMYPFVCTPRTLSRDLQKGKSD